MRQTEVREPGAVVLAAREVMWRGKTDPPRGASQIKLAPSVLA